MGNGLLRLKGSLESAKEAVSRDRAIPGHGDSERSAVSFLISDDPNAQQEPLAMAKALAEKAGARLALLDDSALKGEPMKLLEAASRAREPGEVVVSSFSILSTPQGALFELDGASVPVNAPGAQTMFMFLQAKARSGQSASDSVFVVKGLAEAIGSFATEQEIGHISTAMSALLSPKRKAPLVVSPISSAAFDQLNSAENYPMFLRQSARCFELPGASADLGDVAVGSSSSLLKNLAVRRERAEADKPVAYAGPPPPKTPTA